jgi:hypothetical protein
MVPCPRLVARQPGVGQGRGRRCAQCGRTVVQSCLRALPKQLPLPQSALSDGESDSESSEDTPGLGGDRRAGPGVTGPRHRDFKCYTGAHTRQVWTSMAPAASACRRRSGRAHRHRHHRHRRPRPAAAMRCGCTATDDRPTSGPTTKPRISRALHWQTPNLKGANKKAAARGPGRVPPCQCQCEGPGGGGGGPV